MIKEYDNFDDSSELASVLCDKKIVHRFCELCGPDVCDVDGKLEWKCQLISTCGIQIGYTKDEQIPMNDIICPCGKHYLVKFVENL